MSITHIEYKPYGEDPDGYKVTYNGETIYVPLDPNNPYYQIVQDAIAGGLVVQPASDYLTPEDRAKVVAREALRQTALTSIAQKISKSTSEVAEMSSFELAYELIR